VGAGAALVHEPTAAPVGDQADEHVDCAARSQIS
jgi:hypothetical protein